MMPMTPADPLRTFASNRSKNCFWTNAAVSGAFGVAVPLVLWKANVKVAAGLALNMTYRNMIFLGAALLVVGLFMPIVTMPMVGSVNLFGNGGNAAGLVLMALAALGAGLTLKDRPSDAFWPAVAACGVLAYCFARLQYGLARMRESLRELEGNPFAGLAEGAMGNVQIQWGWLLLAVGAGTMVYAAFKSRDAASPKLLSVPDTTTRRVVAGLALAGLLVLPAQDGIGRKDTTAAATESPGLSLAATAPSVDATTPSREEATYIAQHLEVYALEAKYYNSVLDGRVPGVTFKVKNNGSRTLNKVAVRIVFHDARGLPIAEETYFPVLVSDYSYGRANTPLRPNYIAQQERGQFWSAKSVPTEWQTGRATATITEIEFGPDDEATPST